MAARRCADVERLCRETAKRHKLEVEFRQSNHEGEIVDWIHEAAAKKAAGHRHQPGGPIRTPRSRSATRSRRCKVPVIEVHISNIFARESFRHHSHIAPVAKASLCGFGVDGYALAIDGLGRADRRAHGKS